MNVCFPRNVTVSKRQDIIWRLVHALTGVSVEFRSSCVPLMSISWDWVLENENTGITVSFSEKHRNRGLP